MALTIPPYRYFIMYDTGGSQVMPLNADKFSFQFKREKDQIFFRKTMDTEVEFINGDINKDYDLMMSFESTPCKEIRFRIEKYCNGTYITYWEGYANFYDAKINEDKCTFKITFAPDDDYRCFLENGEVEYNLLETSPVYNTIQSETYKPQLEYIWCGNKIDIGNWDLVLRVMNIPGTHKNGCWDGFPLGSINEPLTISGTPFGNTGFPPYLDIILTMVGWKNFRTQYKFQSNPIGPNVYFYVKSWYYREVWFTKDVGTQKIQPPGSGWQDMGLIHTLENETGISPFQNIPAGYYGTYYFQKPGYRKWVRIPTPIITNWTKYDCIHVYYEADNYLAHSVTIYDNGRYFYDIINYYLSKLNCGYSYESRFFNDTVNPVTTKNPNPLINLYFFQKDDIIDPTATKKAWKGMLSFKRLMQILRDVFQVYWYLESGKFKMEHISYWTNLIPGYAANPVIDYDLTVLDDGAHILGLNRYEFKKVNMPNREHFTMMESGFEDFIGVDIIYSGICTNQRKVDQIRDYTVNDITTDVWFIQNNPNDISKEGFVMIIDYSMVQGGTNAVNGILSGAFIANAPLSWANLHNDYWKWDRVIIEGNMNNTLTTFYDAMKIKIQKDIKFPICCNEFDPTNLITTQIGNGEVETAEENLKTTEITVDLIY